MDDLLQQHDALRKLKAADANIEHVDAVIAALQRARDAVVADPSTAAESLKQAQEPVARAFTSLRKHVKTTAKLHEQYSKQLEKLFKNAEVPDMKDGSDTFTRNGDLLNKAITMHFLREGRFDVADTFVREQEEEARRRGEEADPDGETTTPTDTTMSVDDDDIELSDAPDAAHPDHSPTTAHPPPAHAAPPDDMREDFVRMYQILDEFRKHNLAPAIRWADQHKKALEQKGSTLAFELCRLQFLFLFQGGSPSSSPRTPPRPSPTQRSIAAIHFARAHFHAHAPTHAPEIRELVGALPFAPNLRASPYAARFDGAALWEAATRAFTREYCAVLGLAAESPLLVAATAGVVGLATLGKARGVGGGVGEGGRIISDVPLPRMYRFHPVFICPVMKDATTKENPPALLPCGHVLSLQATEMLGKGGAFKCPYCPKECNPNLVRKLII